MSSLLRNAGEPQRKKNAMTSINRFAPKVRAEVAFIFLIALANLEPVSAQTEARVDGADDGSNSAAVAFHGDGRFAIAWERAISNGNHIYLRRFNAAGTPLAAAFTLTDQVNNDHEHIEPSIDVSAGGNLYVGWAGRNPSLVTIISFSRRGLLREFDFDQTTYVPTGASSDSLGEEMISVGASDEMSFPRAVTWSRTTETMTIVNGLKYVVDFATTGTIRDCDSTTTGDLCWIDRWQSNIAMQADGTFVVAWAEAETPDAITSSFNIHLQAFDEDGTLIGGEVLVNNPADETTDATQESPAIAIDEAGNIVVAWVGPNLDGCSTSPLFHIFARRLFWDGSSTPVFVDLPFQVDQPDADFPPVNVVDANPAVALAQSTDSDICGRFIIAWNGRNTSLTPSRTEVRAQYFNAGGLPIAREFRINQASTDTVTAII